MPKFATKLVEAIKAKEVVEQLCVNDVAKLDEFEKSLNGTTFKSEFATLMRFIEHHANGNSIGKKLVILKNPTKGGIEYEYKSDHLRIYAMQETGKKVVLFGGVKHDADSMDNIKPFRSLKEKYFEFIKTTKK